MLDTLVSVPNAVIIDYLKMFLEIFILTVVIYKTLHYLRGARGASVLAGITILLLVLTLLSKKLNLDVLNWLLTGIWHGAAATFVVWGLYYGLLLILEKFVLRDVLARVPAILRRVLTFLLVVIGWVPFFSDTLGQAGAWLARMFSAGQAGFVDAAALYYLRTAWPVLLIAVFAALPYGCRFGNRFFRAGRTVSMVSSLYFIGLLLLCIAGMVNGTYISFLYAQF